MQSITIGENSGKKRTTEKAREVLHEKQREIRENRAMELFDLIEANPGKNAYWLSQKSGWALSSVQSLLEDLQGLIKIVPTIEKGVTKNKIYVLGLADDYYEEYWEDELDNPLIKDLIRKTQDKGLIVTIHLKNGSRLELSRKE